MFSLVSYGYLTLFEYIFQDGGRYHIETSPLICSDKGLRHEKDIKNQNLKNEKMSTISIFS